MKVKVIWCLVLAVLLGISSWIGVSIRYNFQVLNNTDRMYVYVMAAGNVYKKHGVVTLDLMNQYIKNEEIRKIAFKNGFAVDRYGTEMKVDLTEKKEAFHLKIVSAGMDGVFCTKDDQTLEVDIKR